MCDCISGNVTFSERVFNNCCLLARVLQSKNPAFPVGCYVVAPCGWRTHSVTNGKAVFNIDMSRVPADWPQDVPLSLAVGALGMPG